MAVKQESRGSPVLQNHKLSLPPGFLWGAATASYQVEGNNYSDWTVWEKSQRRCRDLQKKGLPLETHVAGVATDHYNRFEEDFQMAKELGHNVHRLSLEWSRIEPEEGKFNQTEIDHYKEVMKSLRAKGIEPMVTIWHTSYPVWFAKKHGWSSPDAPKVFNRYVEKVVGELKGDVKMWITINEPELFAALSFLGMHPRETRSLTAAARSTRNLTQGHIAAYETIKKIQPDAQVGITINSIHFDAKEDNKLIRWGKERLDESWNDVFLREFKDHLDFIGLHQYFHFPLQRNLLKSFNPDGKIMSDSNWELNPESMYHMLHHMKKYNLPIYITEHGLADGKDAKRPWYIYETVQQIHKAIEDGVDVRGYIHWTLMDNFEWHEGYGPKFGLVDVDRSDHLTRTPRRSAYLLRDIAKANGITAKIEQDYADVLGKPNPHQKEKTQHNLMKDIQDSIVAAETLVAASGLMLANRLFNQKEERTHRYRNAFLAGGIILAVTGLFLANKLMKRKNG